MAKFILGYTYEDDALAEFPSRASADDMADDWCVVEADTLEKAKAGYEDAFAAWQLTNG